MKKISKYNSKNEESKEEIYKKIIEIISGDDKKVLAQVEELVTKPEVFFSKYREQFEERGIDDFSTLPTDDVLWLGLADILIENNYAQEFDWKCELEDFEYFFKNLKQFNKEFFNSTFSKLNEDENIEEWCKILNIELSKQGMVIIQMDIDSDSYILFFIRTEDFLELGKLAKKIEKTFRKEIY